MTSDGKCGEFGDEGLHAASAFGYFVAFVTGRPLRALCGARLDVAFVESEGASPRCPWCASGERFEGSDPFEHAHETTSVGEVLAVLRRRPVTAVCGLSLEEPLPPQTPGLCPKCRPRPPRPRRVGFDRTNGARYGQHVQKPSGRRATL